MAVHAPLHLPRRVHGRASETAQLVQAFERVAASGRCEMLLLSGPAGIGKSTLACELRTSLAPARGRFIEGRFDALTRDVPCAALDEALRSLMRQALSESDSRVDEWRRELLQALGGNGRVVTGMMPALLPIAGAQPDVVALAPNEAQNRLRRVFRKFVGVFARAEHPLVLFLADLQWADETSLALLRELVTHPQTGSLLVLGSYRDDELDPEAPFARWLQGMRNEDTRLATLALPPLSPADMHSLVADVLHRPLAQVKELAEHCAARAAGSPLFAVQWLLDLHAQGLIWLDEHGHWQWEDARIAGEAAPAGAAALIAQRVARVPAPARQALAQLALARDAAVGEASLAPAVQAGLVVRRRGVRCFAHECVSEAVLASISADERAALSLTLGRRMLSHGSDDKTEQHLFEVASALCRGAALVTDEAQRNELRALCQRAGTKARAAGAHAAAVTYLSRAVALLPTDAWTTQTQVSFALHLDLAESEYLAGHVERSAQLHALLLDKAASRLERARAWRLRMRMLQVGYRNAESVAVLLQALHDFGMEFPESDDGLVAAFEHEQAQVANNLRGRSIADLAGAPPCRDPEVAAVVGLITESVISAFVVRPPLFALLAVRALNLMLQHGHCPDSGFAYLAYASLLAGRMLDIPSAARYAELALTLSEKSGDPITRGRLLHINAVLVNHWHRPLAVGRLMLERAVAACIEVGDVRYAGLSVIGMVTHAIAKGESLEAILERVRRADETLQRYRMPVPRIALRLYGQFARCLQGATHAPDSFDEEGINEHKLLSQLAAADYVIGAVCNRILRMMAAVIYDQREAALVFAESVEALPGTAVGLALSAASPLFHGLAASALCDEAQGDKRARLFAVVRDKVQRLSLAARHAPGNFACHHALLAAELARLEHREFEAERLYEKAISAARSDGFHHVEALAYERAARFYRERGLASLAEAFLQHARDCYVRWGAHGKVAQLDARLPGPRAVARGEVRQLQLDTLAIVKASQAISSRLEFDELLDTLMRIAVETAGAERGLLLLAEGDSLRPAAEAAVQRQHVQVTLHARRRGGVLAHPTAIVNHVQRTRERVLLADAAELHAFSGDAYVREHALKSVLCLPLLRRGELLGVLYLENNLATQAFTPERLAVVDLLVSQAAISLETARLYSALKHENEQRRRAEDTLHEEQERWRRLFDSEIIGIRIADHSGRIIDGNDAFLRLIGHTRAELEAGTLRWTDLTPPQWRGMDEAMIAKLSETGQFEAYETEYLHRDGHRVPVLIGGASYGSAPPKTIAFVLDLTARRQAEAEREARYAAELASKAKSEFLASMSHELRTPLNAVLGYAQILALDETLGERQRRGINTIESSGQHLLALITDILDLARIEAGKLGLDPVPVDLLACVGTVADIMRVKADEKRLTFALETASELPRTVSVDEKRLSQVLLNLVGNAIKFTDSGQVTLRVRVGLAPGALRFEVEDTGIGIGADDLLRVFEPFEQAGSTRRRQAGAGLGLAISRALVRLMGGDIVVDSVVGRGTRFSFELELEPMPIEPKQGDAPRMPLGYTGERRRVLVVDDIPANRDVLVDYLQLLGFNTVLAEDGRQALAMAQQQRPEAILIDSVMPLMDGREATRALRTMPGLGNVPIIAMSANASEQSERLSLDAGADAFLPKPVNLAALASTLGSLMKLSWVYR